jgi:hypothetical protein
MPEDTKRSSEEPETSCAAPSEPVAEEELVRTVLEEARQQVKRIAKLEREGEKINRELLNFRMRQVHDP